MITQNKDDEFDFEEYLEEDSSDFSAGLQESDFESEPIGSGKDRVLGIYEKIFSLILSILFFWIISLQVETAAWTQFFLVLLITLIVKIVSGFLTYMVFSVFIRKRITGVLAAKNFKGFDVLNFFLYHATHIILITFLYMIMAPFIPGFTFLIYTVSAIISTLVCSTIAKFMKERNIFIALFSIFVGILTTSMIFYFLI